MAECGRCAREMADVGVVCHPCTAGLTFELLRGAIYAHAMIDTIARQDRVAVVGGARVPTMPNDTWEHGPLALEAHPLPVNLAAAEAHRRVEHTVSLWAIACGKGKPYHPLPMAMVWLTSRLGWLRMQDSAVQAWQELHDAVLLAHRTVDAPPDRVLAGRCDCGAYLYGVTGRATVRCHDCGMTYDVEQMRTMLRAQADAMLLTAAEIATLAAHLDLSRDRDRTRKLLNKMAQRKLILPHGILNGQPIYRSGEVLAKLAARLSPA